MTHHREIVAKIAGGPRVNVDVQLEQGAVVVLEMAPMVPRPIDPLRLLMTVAEARALVTVPAP
jgi:hypothetical protein